MTFNACVNWRVTETGTTHCIGFVPEETESFVEPIYLAYTGPLEQETYAIIIDDALNNEAPESNFAFRTNTAAPGFDGYRRITSPDLSILDQEDLRTLSFNGHFALENYRAGECALRDLRRRKPEQHRRGGQKHGPG